MSVSGLVEFELWGRNKWPSRKVVGESFHESAIRSLFPAPFGERSRELTLRAALVTEPGNKVDPYAVMVIAGGQHVGYLARDDARAYQPVVMGLRQQGLLAVTDCRVYAWDREEWLGTDRRGHDVTKQVLEADVTLVLDDWWMCVPANLPPAVSHTLLPQGSAIQARREEDHQVALRPFLRAEGEAWVYATLGVITDQSTRTTKELVEIRIDEQRVGELTPAMSAEYIPIIRQLEQSGRATAARAIVKGNQIKADVVLYAAKTSQLDAQWIAANAAAPAAATGAAALVRQAGVGRDHLPEPSRGHEPVPPKPTRIRFNVPPGWPAPPDGWEPQPGWTPAPEWPTAPTGWAYWIASD